MAAKRRNTPTQERARQTYEHLLDITAELLGEVGVERISTNLICERAGMTPPALYRYFPNKYAVLGALGQRLFGQLDEILEEWIETNRDRTLQDLVQALEPLQRDISTLVQRAPGAIWILRAMRSVPQLIGLRLKFQRSVCDRLCALYGPLLPDIPRKTLWLRMRIATEFSFATEEMLFEETRIPKRVLLKEKVRLLRGPILEG